MANNLFTKEDFIKNKTPRKNQKRKYIYWIILIVVVAVAMFLIHNYSKETPLEEEVKNVEIIPSEKSIDESNVIINESDNDVLLNTIPVVDVEVELKETSNINVEQMAWSVIRGNYGNNPVRRQKLGDDYQIIQDKVNEFYRKGLVH